MLTIEAEDVTTIEEYTPWTVLLSIGLLMVFRGCYWASIGAWLPSVVRTDQQRATVVSIGYNLGLGFFGGTAPVISESLVHYAPSGHYLVAWLMCVVDGLGEHWAYC